MLARVWVPQTHPVLARLRSPDPPDHLVPGDSPYPCAIPRPPEHRSVSLSCFVVEHMDILMGGRLLFEDISKASPKEFLDIHFRPVLPVWFKVYRHLMFMNLVVSPGEIAPNGRSGVFYILCVDFWTAILNSINDPQSRDAKGSICSNPRCSDPGILKGTGYACSQCWRIHYCTPRCQAL